MIGIVIQLIYCLWVVFLAYINAGWIKNAYRVRHFFNGAAHLILAGVLWYHFGLLVAVASLCLIRVVFDGALYLFLGLPFDYAPTKPRSIVDRLEQKVFGKNGITPKLFWLAVAIILNLIK